MGVYRTKPFDAAVHESGWAEVDGVEITRLPLVDLGTDPLGKSFARLTYQDALEVAAREGAQLLTTAQVGKVWETGVKLKPVILPPTGEMASLEWCQKHDAGVWKQLDGWNGVTPVANCGKDWIHGATKGRALNYGWFDPKAPNGRMWQSLGTQHDASHVDYSQLTRLVRPVRKGWIVSIAEILKRWMAEFESKPSAEAPVEEPAMVPAQKTVVSPKELYNALIVAWVERFGATPKREQLLTLLAQWSIETAAGKSMFNFNVGNSKRVKGQKWTMFSTHEVLKGQKILFKPPHPQTHFAAFDTLEDGARFYLDLMHRRFSKAWPAVEAGDPALFSKLLKQSRYYTANEAEYTSAILAHYRALSKQV